MCVDSREVVKNLLPQLKRNNVMVSDKGINENVDTGQLRLLILL